MEVQRLPGDRLVIRVDGTFDVPAAEEVARALGADAASAVRIDLTHVREFHDFGVAVLARAISTRAAPVDVRGLGWHQRRILGYLGISTDEAAAAEAELA